MEAVIGVLIIVIVVFAIVTLLRSVRIVPQQRMDVVERLGKYKRTLSARASTCWSPSSTRYAARWTCASRSSRSRRSR